MHREDFSDDHRVGPDTGTGTRYNYGSAGGQGGSSFRGGSDTGGGTIAEASLFAAGKHVGRGPRGYRRSDASIREELSERLMWDDDLDVSEVEISVTDGVVLLTGMVLDREDKFRVEEIAAEISGVREVTNQIRHKRHGWTSR